MVMPSCCSCGSPVDGVVGRGRPRKYCLRCSPRRASLSLSHTHACQVCGRVFDGSATRKYCSKACVNKRREERRKIPCSSCGERGWPTRGAVGPYQCRECRRDPSKHEHGTYSNYRRGCRCAECVQARRDEEREYRSRRRAAGDPVKRFGSSGPWIAESVRISVFERDGWVCQLCGEPTDRLAGPNSDWFPSLDHIVPQSKGGGHDRDNLRTAHRWCNAVRGAEDFHAELFEVA